VKIILTGSSGFLGTWTYNRLSESGHDIIPMDKKSSGLEKEIIIDLSSLETQEILRIVKDAQAIIHIASVVDFSESFNKEIFEVNTLLSFRLARIAKLINSHFVFISGSFVHGRHSNKINKGVEDNPDLPYSLSKWLAEKLIEETYDKVTILRVCGIFGLNGPTHLGINKSISLALKEKVPPIVYGNGLGRRNYIYVKDVSKNINFIINNKIYGRFYVAGKEILSIKEMAEQICEVLLPNNLPLFVQGKETYDQIVEPSIELPTSITFREALYDIKKNHDQDCSIK
jgi:UDP-glucose 4-epimerase